MPHFARVLDCAAPSPPLPAAGFACSDIWASIMKGKSVWGNASTPPQTENSFFYRAPCDCQEAQWRSRCFCIHMCFSRDSISRLFWIVLKFKENCEIDPLKRRRHGILLPDRKSTRLNSSHTVISYAV